jgi:hypothetical protein
MCRVSFSINSKTGAITPVNRTDDDNSLETVVTLRCSYRISSTCADADYEEATSIHVIQSFKIVRHSRHV